MKNHTAAVATATLCLFASAQPSAQTPAITLAVGPYTIKNVAPGCLATAINAAGWVTGSGSLTNDHSFLYNGASTVDLGTLPGGTSSFGQAINGSGQVVGYAILTSGAIHAFLYNGTSMVDLGTLPGGTNSYAYGINDSGQITGYSDPNLVQHAFLYQNGTMTDLGAPGGADGFSRGYGINASGVVAGEANFNGFGHAAIYNGTSWVDLATLPGYTTSVGLAINASGEVTGNSYSHNTGAYDTFLYNGSSGQHASTFFGKRHVNGG